MNRWFLSLLAAITFFSCKTQKPVAGPERMPEEVQDQYYEAELSYLSGNSAEARKQFEAVLKAYPAAAAHFRLACLNKNISDYPKALDEIRKAEQLDTANYQYNVFEAGILEKLHRYKEAGEIFHRLAVKYPSRWSFFVDGAKFLKMAGDPNALIAFCNDWEKAFGLRIEPVSYRTEAWFQLGENQNAFNDWKKLIALHPENTEYRLTLAKMYLRSGFSDSAGAIYEGISQKDPGNMEVAEALCDYYNRKPDRKAQWLHSKKVVLIPSLDVWKKQQCLSPFFDTSAKNEYRDSLETPLKQLILMHPDDHLSWMFLSNWYYSRRQYQLAIAPFSRGLELHANDFQAWSRYTDCLDRTGRYESMEKATDTMIELFPSTPVVELIAATAALKNNRLKQAQDHCETGLVYAVDNSSINQLKLLLARVLNKSGKKQEAYDMLNDLMNTFPRDKEIGATLAWLYAQNSEQVEKGLQLVNDAISDSATAPNFEIKARLLELKGDQPGATASIQKAINIDPKGEYYLFLGDLTNQSNHKLAEKYWQTAWDMGYHTEETAQRLGIPAQKIRR